MRRLLGTIGILLIASACAGPPAEPPGTASTAPTPTASSSTTASPQSSPPNARQITVQVWFVHAGKLFVATRRQDFQPAVGRLSLEALLAGPTEAERRAGLATAIPEGASLSGLTIRNGVATVNLSLDFAIDKTARLEDLRLAQVVYTLTQFSTVKSVTFQVNGQTIQEFGSHPQSLARPQTRRDYDELLPAIVVTSPAIGASVSSPVLVKGTANVFEATVSLRILDASGRQIARTFTTATCGTGCRGDYAKKVGFSVSSKQDGTIEVFEASAQDGRAINVVKIPVTLLP